MPAPTPTAPTLPRDRHVPAPRAGARSAAGPPVADARFGRAGALVRAAREGDVLALDELIDLMTPYITRVCRPIALDETPDAVQETLIALFRGLDRLADPDACYAWVRTVAVREAVRVQRRARRAEPVADPADVPSPEDHELVVHVHDVLRRLPAAHREVLVLRELAGLGERAAGELLDLPGGTVKSRLHRARAGFREAWRA
ncbi:RNA polymerase sigma factor [Streptomyces sp. NRRL S-87]|uniref:RNA polymerase sigma factor n=1 Tax=Streptomyces sp. NRRL S-87 TaxID=1463920 RepID=UPI00099C33CF|nr:sigma-70 family RNA polymerase sigma factor [Streptomyces sp. NRRL S-87]